MQFILPFFNGFLIGIPLCLMLGTVFFTLVQNSIRNGPLTGILVSLGVILSDILLIALVTVDWAFLPRMSEVESWVRILGAILFITIGIITLVHKQTLAYPPAARIPFYAYMLNGFLLNILNPGNFFQWVAVSLYVSTSTGYQSQEVVTFYTGALFAILATQTLISYSAHYVKRHLNETVLNRLHWVTAAVFFILAIVLVWPLFG